VPGTVVAAAFAVFNPAVVIPSVDTGWTLTDARTICQARDDGAIAQLERILGPEPEGVERVEELLRQTVAPLRPEGRPLYAGVAAQPMPATALGRVWRLGDMLREFRGDCHTAAWVGAGLDAVEIGLLSELYWGLPMRSYARTRAWSDEQFDIAFDRLRTRNLVDDRGFLDAGRDLREAIEVSTDRQMVRAMVGLDTHLDELLDIVLPWGTAIRAAKGYPASGPHDLAEHASKG
jgi:AcrR family transcriptional regulator